MITAETTQPATAFASRMAQKAAVLAEAHGENILRQRARDPWRWRSAALLWPLFSKG
ncbi:hypothetical protein GRI44_09775 [Altererythrobacter confluentis]|uniref:Uncharacterized protein n=1 Tax=Allopontixanthobacter confluentis TaxID=1849021 RepID=A0A6L7GHN4_9SPHN|nr:hypothetical protein [Allopontixanthobacter confluentis]MXP15035.1 hypothetical protein [Allopontixanthobacter confluentis]